MEKKTERRKYSVKIPIYNIQTEMYIGEESVPSTMDIKTDGLDGSVQVLERDGIKKIVIWLRRMEWTTSDIGTMVHELYHAVNKLYLIIGATEGIDEEFWAYHLQYLVVEYSKKINSKKIRKSQLKKVTTKL